MEAGAIRIGSGAGIPSAPGDLASYIDHTLLKPDATADQVIALCEEAKKYQFASVCINPTWVSLAAKILAGTKVRVCTVIGFPLGATASSVKAYETRRAATDGAGEIDMVINIGALKSKNFKLVEEDIRRVVESAGDRIVKVILETALLTDEEKIIGCTLSKAAGAHFVKTSTGFGPGGATVKDVALMREAVGEDMGVKASGGVRDTKTAMEMVKAGATRIGASASVAIVSGQAAGSGKY
ncbi:MAG: deoxyribose-phosphate aldolase [Candidatus Wallbacteria bacterium]|nr:deoxyribose-phosphate aldolase [Candidatus Wallbacteria bacterium]